MKVIECVWFTPSVGHVIGVVIGVDEVTGKRKAYIGAVSHGGVEEYDTKVIMERGAKLSKEVLLEIVGKLA